MGALLLSHFSLLMALSFQVFGMVTAYKVMEIIKPVFGHIPVIHKELLA